MDFSTKKKKERKSQRSYGLRIEARIDKLKKIQVLKVEHCIIFHLLKPEPQCRRLLVSIYHQFLSVLSHLCSYSTKYNDYLSVVEYFLTKESFLP